MAPDLHSKNYNSQVDVFSLGAVMYSMFSGKLDQEMPWLMVEAQRPTRLRESVMAEFGAHYSAPLIELMFSMLHDDPKQRPTAAVLKERLTKW